MKIDNFFQKIFFTVAEQPTNLIAYISHSSSSQVIISVSWKANSANGAEYIIYYEGDKGVNSSARVTGSEATLEGLPRGFIYYVSIVALLANNLPSHVVGPVPVTPCEFLHIISSLFNSSSTTVYFEGSYILLSNNDCHDHSRYTNQYKSNT